MTDDPASEAYVRIGIRDIYAEQRIHGEKLTKIEASLENVTFALREIADQDLRIRSLEKWKAALPVSLFLAIVSVAAVIVGVIHN